MGKSSKKSKKHHKKRSSSESSESQKSSPKRVDVRMEEERHHRRRGDHSEDNRGFSSKWDSPEESSGSHRRYRERQHVEQDHRHGGRHYEERRERPREHNSPREEFRDNRRRREDRPPEEPVRRHRDNRERERHHEERHAERHEPNDRFQDRNRRQDEGRRRRDRSRSPQGRKFPRRHDDDDKNYEWGKSDKKSFGDQKEPAEKEKPNFGLSGKLTEDTNKVNGVVIKYAEPQEARKPKRRWRLYPFKGEQALPTMYIHRQSCFLIGRDHKVCDLRVDHPSCSKQHAALQYRLVPFEREDGSVGKRVRPYVIDLDSANGTFVNNNKIEPRKYVELLEKDVIKFGFSSREYVLLHENSHEEVLDDDVNPETEIKEEPAD
ncbi:FHA domain-containing protein [Sergentomyia squamirostris]